MSVLEGFHGRVIVKPEVSVIKVKVPRVKVDSVVETVRYNDEGDIQEVKLYDRIGVVFSDWKLASREDLLRRLHDRQKISAGKRYLGLGNSVETSHLLRLERVNGKELIVSDHAHEDHDFLAGVPLF